MDSETTSQHLADLASLLPTTASKIRKPLRCVVTEAIRDELLPDIPSNLVENSKITQMLDYEFS